MSGEAYEEDDLEVGHGGSVGSENETERDEPGTTTEHKEVNRDDLKTLLETEKRQRAAAESRLQSVERERDQYRGTSTHNQNVALDQALVAREARKEQARKDLADAWSNGEFEKAAKVQEEIANLAVEVADIKRQKADVERQVKQPPQQRQTQQREDDIDMSVYSNAQRDWINRNPEYKRDGTVRNRVAAAHYLAEADGVAVDSREYFERMDAAVKPPQQARQRAPEREDTGEMPVQRRGSDASEGRRDSTTIKLTREEREHADITMPDAPERPMKDSGGNIIEDRYTRYFKAKQRLTREGRFK